MPAGLISDTELKSLLTELRRKFETLYCGRLKKMILYGSHARREAKRWSDVDVLVVLKGPVRPSQEVRRTSRIVSQVCLDFDTDIQCLFTDESSYGSSREPLLDAVRREGIEV